MGILDALLNPGGQNSGGGLGGLLGGLLNPGSLSPEQQQGLRAATARIAELSGPSRMPRSFMQIATSGMSAFDEGVQSARDRKVLEEQRALQQQLLGLKLKDAEADFGYQQKGREREDRISKRTAGIWGAGGMPPGLDGGMGMEGGTVPTVSGGRMPMPGGGGLMNPEGRTPASHMGGGDFVRAAQAAGLPTDMDTLNQIIGYVNQGQSLDQATASLGGNSGMQGRRMISPPPQGGSGFAPPPQQMAGPRGLSMPVIGSPEWAQGIQQQMGGDPSNGSASGKIGGADLMQNYQKLSQLGLPPELALSAASNRMSAPGTPGKRPNQTQMMVQNLMSEARVRFEEGDKAGAEKMLDMIQKFRPTATWKEVTQGNRVGYQAFFDDGEQGDVSDANVAAKLHFEDAGPYTLGLDAYTGAERTRYKKGMSPAEAASNGMQRERLRYEQQRDGRPVYSAEAGGFIMPPSRANPNGGVIPLAGSAVRGPKMTEDQAKATGWLVQAENAWKNMQAVAYDPEGNLTDAARPGRAEAMATAVPFGMGEAAANSMRSADRQKFMQGASSLSESLLRAATGAGVNQDEALQKMRELTPVWGDTPEVIQQKMEAVPLYLDSLKVRSGPGARQAADVLERDAQRRGGAGKFSITTPDGRTFDFPDAKSLANFKFTTGLK